MLASCPAWMLNHIAPRRGKELRIGPVRWCSRSPGARSRTHLPEEPPLSIPETWLAELPLDDFLKLVLKGALRVTADTENPIRLSLLPPPSAGSGHG